jgi:hypothetical protein
MLTDDCAELSNLSTNRSTASPAGITYRTAARAVAAPLSPMLLKGDGAPALPPLGKLWSPLEPATSRS